ncbi:MAG: 6-carboxytetrahydropterin synthase [Rhodospirillales bacterium]
MKEKLYFAAATGFEAARSVSILPEGHRSRRLHGHSFIARIRADVPETWAAFPGGETDELTETLQRSVQALDYDCLNNHIETPTDENIARWLREQVNVTGVDVCGVQSTLHEGADLDENGHAHIWRRYRFEAAHQLPNVPPGHKCGRMHGHGFEVILHANQNLSGEDMGVDYDYLDQCWEPIFLTLDHACLNDIPGLDNPTSEALAAWIWERLKPNIAELSWVTVYETVTAGCQYDGRHYRIWKEQRFESALRLERAPEDNRRNLLHGHSYIVRLHLSAPLDPIMNWAIDYGDVKELFKPVYKSLDHHLLNELPGIGDADLASVAKWIRGQVSDSLPELDRIDLFQAPGCGAVLTWGEAGPALPT